MTSLKYLFLTLLLTLNSISIFSQSWTQQNSGASLNLHCIYFTNANTGFIGADSGKILKTSNSGLNWTVQNIITSTNLPLVGIKFFIPLEGVAAGEMIMRTTNGGLTWFSVCDTAFATDASFIDENNWIISSNFGHPNKKTTNKGISWVGINYSDILQMCVYFPNINTGWIAGKGPVGSFVPQHVDKTTNGGFNWTTQYSGILLNNNGWFYDLHFIDVNTGFGALSETSSNTLIKTTNSGANWFAVSTANFPRGIFFINTSIGWTSCSLGKIMKTMNTGLNWATEQTPVTSTLKSVYFVTNETGWVCGDGGVILKTTNGGITAIQQTGINIPIEFNLHQNYPNPFNPSTNIKFDVPKSSFITLTIYDAIGKEISVLVHENLNAGSYSVDWDASTQPSGVYFYRLTAGGFSETKKVVLIK